VVSTTQTDIHEYNCW